MTDLAAQYRSRTASELALTGNHPDDITKHLDAYEAQIRAAAFREAADLIKSDDACARPAHQDYYVLLLRQRADALLGEATR